MKRIHFISLVILLSSVFTFTSCLDSDNESNYDVAGFMTLENFMSVYSLKPDFSDHYFVPSNPEILKLVDKDGKPTDEYMKRGRVYVKFVEGEVFPQDGKKSYKVNIIGADMNLPVQSMEKPENEELSNPLYKFGSDFWGSNGYINISFYPTHEKDEKLEIEDFDLYMDKVSNNTLYLKLNHSIAKVENPVYSDYGLGYYFSYSLPSKYEIMDRFPDLGFGKDGNTIKVKVTASGMNERELESSEFEVVLTY